MLCYLVFAVTKGARLEMFGTQSKKGMFSSGSSRQRGLVSWLPVIPEEELNPVPDFAIANNMESWLVKICHDSEIPAAMVANGHFSLVEKAAREDAALEIVGRVLETTDKEIRDYNYFKINLLRNSNNAFKAKLSQLEDAHEKLIANYETVVNAHINGQSP
ncbi:uncharacterized protein DS421_11g333040 [Arachis hypogaea]|nr:uncharacterized protein DS421_11g333040 [Arachis hypogaea]